VSEEAVYDMLNLTLKAKDVSPQEVASPPKASSSEESGKSGSNQLQPGKAPKLDLGDASGKPAAQTSAGALVTNMLANASGSDPQDAMEQAKEKDVPFQKAYKNLVTKVAEESEEEVATVKKVLDWLLNNEKIVPTTKVAFGESSLRGDNLIFERWGRLAGVIKESREPLDELSNEKEEAGTGDPSDKGKPDEGKPSAEGEKSGEADNKKPAASGENAKLASLIARETKVSPKIVGPILDALVQKCGVKLAK
jgi:hypothetical protein